MKRTYISGLCWITTLLPIGTGACSASDGETFASFETAEEELLLGGASWPQGIVPVCWSSTSVARRNFATEAALVKRRLTETWQAVANVHFTGWVACSGSTRGKVVINLDDSIYANATVGFATSGTVVNLGVGRTDFATGLVPHEFGHVLGFRHEMNRSDFVDDPTGGCRASNSTGDTLGTPADRGSIMASTGYCNTNAGLSPWDISGARVTYGAPKLINNARSGLCLGVVGVDNHARGARAEVYGCAADTNDARRDQQWEEVGVDSTYFQLRNKASALCLGVVGEDSHNSGAAVEVYDCAPASGDPRRDEHWYRVSKGQNYSEYRNRTSGLCLGVVGGNNHGPGARAAVYTCGGVTQPAADHQWATNDLPQSFVTHRRIVDSQSGWCLGVQGRDSNVNGSLAEIYSCQSYPGDPMRDSEWKLQSVDSQYYKLVNGATGALCLGVQGVDVGVTGLKVEAYSCNALLTNDPLLDQQWLTQQLWDGTVLIRNRVNLLCLDATSSVKGAGLTVASCTDAGSWIIE